MSITIRMTSLWAGVCGASRPQGTFQQFSVHLHNKSYEVTTVTHISQVEKLRLRMHCRAQEFEDRCVRLETGALLMVLYCPIVRAPSA